ncbi:MAG: hypothetical protein ACRC28_00145 [Clostridium sp.]|uniref:hypothetical protein n=1 Tax=Clostridium sp. TaxID=1506 RepID=UPI003F3BF607
MGIVRFLGMFFVSNLICLKAHALSIMMMVFTTDSGGVTGGKLFVMIPVFLIIAIFTVGLPLVIVQKLCAALVDKNFSKEERKLRGKFDNRGVIGVLLIYIVIGINMHL